MKLAYCLWGLTGTQASALTQVAEAKIGWIDIRPNDLTSKAACARYEAHKLKV